MVLTYTDLKTVMHGTSHGVHAQTLTSSTPIFPERCVRFPGSTRVDLKSKSHRCFGGKKSYPHVLSASPPRGMVQTRCTPVFVLSLLPQVSRSNALIAVTIKCLTAMIDHVELRYSTKCYSPPPTLSLLLTTLSPTPMIPLTTTTTTPLYLLACEEREVKRRRAITFGAGCINREF